MTKRMQNVSLRDFRLFLFNKGLERKDTHGGHETWVKDGLLRPVIIQTHIDPVPEFIIKNALRTLGVSKQEFQQALDNQ